MIQYSFHMLNELSDVDRVVLSMKACVDETLSSSAQFKFEIGVSEALANVVKHATPSDPTAPIAIELSETDTAVRVEIVDPIDAQPFDPCEHAQPLSTVDPLAESGRGLCLIFHCTDDVEYGLKADRMCLSLTFSKSGD